MFYKKSKKISDEQKLRINFKKIKKGVDCNKVFNDIPVGLGVFLTQDKTSIKTTEISA